MQIRSRWMQAANLWIWRPRRAQVLACGRPPQVRGDAAGLLNVPRLAVTDQTRAGPAVTTARNSLPGEWSSQRQLSHRRSVESGQAVCERHRRSKVVAVLWALRLAHAVAVTLG